MSSTSTTVVSTEPKLPTDIIFQVLCHSDPRDTIQWRTVSKVFYAIAREMALWKTLYKNASFPRPPGPFSTQSVTFLERTLLKATRLAESWTTRPMRALSSLTINIDKGDKLPIPLKLISGRWLVVFESCRRFVLHDVDPVAGKHTQQVMWGQETPQVSDWDVESIVSPEGHCMVYLMVKFRLSWGWKLLEFRLNYDTGELLHSGTIDPPQTGSKCLYKVKLYAGNSQLLFIPVAPKVCMVLDTRTHVFYNVPSLPQVQLEDPRIMFSDTSFISLDHYDYTTTVYAFTLLPDGAAGETGQRTLCLTHEGAIPTYARLVNVKAMKPAVDLATGATNIRLLCSTDLGPLELKCVEMTLLKCSPGVVIPINIETRDIKLPRERVRLSRYENHCQYIDVSDDGQIRGFFRAEKREPRSGIPRPWDTIENQLVMKFTIDTTQDPWVITRSQIAPGEWSEEDDPGVDRTGEGIFFDGTRGRLCYPRPREPNRLVVADIE